MASRQLYAWLACSYLPLMPAPNCALVPCYGARHMPRRACCARCALYHLWPPLSTPLISRLTELSIGLDKVRARLRATSDWQRINCGDCALWRALAVCQLRGGSSWRRRCRELLRHACLLQLVRQRGLETGGIRLDGQYQDGMLD